jgi:hypothetical protein
VTHFYQIRGRKLLPSLRQPGSRLAFVDSWSAILSHNQLETANRTKRL